MPVDTGTVLSGQQRSSPHLHLRSSRNRMSRRRQGPERDHMSRAQSWGREASNRRVNQVGMTRVVNQRLQFAMDQSEDRKTQQLWHHPKKVIYLPCPEEPIYQRIHTSHGELHDSCLGSRSPV